MAARVVEDSLDAQIGILEAVLPDEPGYLQSAYPYPSLRPTERVEQRSFRLVSLENDLIRVALAPDLGGRIVKFEDRGGDPLAQGSMVAVIGGSRGAFLPMGIGIALNDGDSPASLGSAWIVADQDEAAVATCQLAGPIDYSSRYSVPEGAREVEIEVRVHNRLLEDAPYNGGLCVGGAWDAYRGEGGTILLWGDTLGIGLALQSDDDSWAVDVGPHVTTLSRLPIGTRFSLGPRQVDTFRFVVSPAVGFVNPPAVFPGGAWQMGPEGIEIAPSRSLRGWKLIVETALCTVETMLDLSPETPYSASAAEIGSAPLQAALRTPEGREFVYAQPARVTPQVATLASAAEADTRHRESLRAGGRPSPLLPGMKFEHAMRAAHASLQSRGASDEADAHLEQALLFNAEDPLAWWLKAANRRLMGESGEERAELLNAHYLSPLEPILRAEGFLSQPQSGQPASAVVKPLLAAPESFIECACLLIEANLRPDAMRWIEESLQHIDLPMLHYLMASCAFDAELDADAGAHLAAAAKLPFGPPFPWHDVERACLDRLSKRFPDDAPLARYAHLVRSTK